MSQGGDYQIVFFENGVASNKWLGGSSTPSNQAPQPIPFDSELIALFITNSKGGADIDIEIYKSLEGTGSTNSLFFTWVLRNFRTADKSDTPLPLTFSQGDKVAVFSRDQGGNASDVALYLLFKTTNLNVRNHIEDFAGDF